MENRKKGCGCAGCIVPVFVIICIAIIVSIIGYVVGDNDSDTPTPSPSGFEYDDDTSDVVIDNSASNDSYYYNCLNDGEKSAYNSALSSALNGKDTFVVYASTGVDSNDEMWRVIKALTYDHPELYWINCGWDKVQYSGKDATISFSNGSYWDYSIDQTKRISALEEEVEKAAKLAKKNASDEYGMVKFVHDYLVDLADYDYDAVDEYFSANRSASCEYIFTAYGCLVNHRTVCAGYAKAFQMIMNKLGIPCTYVSGFAGENHAWNRVTIDGNGYYIDLTWDDKVFDKKQVIDYSYFNFTTSELLNSRTLDESFSQPLCTETECNYYVRNGYLVNNYSIDAVKNIVVPQLSEPTVDIKFTSADDFKRALDDMKNGKWTNVCGISGYSYITDENMLTVTLFVK